MRTYPAAVENPAETCYIAVMTDKQTQLEKFKQAAREHEADEDEARWDERLKKVVRVKPEPDSPPK